MEPTNESSMSLPETTSETAAPGSNRSALMIVFLVVFIDLLGFGIVLPLMPRIAETYVEQVLGPGRPELTGAVIGLLMSSFSFMQFLFSPMWGRISDRAGRRPILLIGLAGSVVFYALFGYALSLDPANSAALALTLFFVARIGAGLFGATIATAQAVIADSTSPEKRKHGMALIGAAFGIGFTFGPLIGYVALITDRLDSIGYTAAGLSLIALALGVVLLPETRRFETEPPHKRGWIDFSALRFVVTSRDIGPVILIFFLATLGFGSFEVTLALLLKDALAFALQETLLMFAYVGLVLVIAQGVFYRRLAKRVSEATFIQWGIILMGAGIGALGAMTYGAHVQQQGGAFAVPLLPLLYFGTTAAVFGFAFLTPSTNALISRRTDANRQGEILGVNQSAASMARILGPVLGVTAYKMTADHLVPYAVGAAILLLMLPMVPWIRREG